MRRGRVGASARRDRDSWDADDHFDLGGGAPARRLNAEKRGRYAALRTPERASSGQKAGRGAAGSGAKSFGLKSRGRGDGLSLSGRAKKGGSAPRRLSDLERGRRGSGEGPSAAADAAKRPKRSLEAAAEPAKRRSLTTKNRKTETVVSAITREAQKKRSPSRAVRRSSEARGSRIAPPGQSFSRARRAPAAASAGILGALSSPREARPAAEAAEESPPAAEERRSPRKSRAEEKWAAETPKRRRRRGRRTRSGDVAENAIVLSDDSGGEESDASNGLSSPVAMSAAEAKRQKVMLKMVSLDGRMADGDDWFAQLRENDGSAELLLGRVSAKAAALRIPGVLVQKVYTADGSAAAPEGKKAPAGPNEASPAGDLVVLRVDAFQSEVLRKSALMPSGGRGEGLLGLAPTLPKCGAAIAGAIADLRPELSVEPAGPEELGALRAALEAPGGAGPRRSRRSQSRYSSSSMEAEAAEVLRYPFDSPAETDVISLAGGDVLRLADGEYLNDNLVDFYIKYLSREHRGLEASRACMERVHVFSSQFFTALVDASSGRAADERAHRAVEHWTKNVAVFEKDFLLVPIAQDLHWSLAAVCFPSAVEGMPNRGAGKPCVVFMDPMPMHPAARFKQLLCDWLRFEAKKRRGRMPMPVKLPLVKPRLPRQKNGYDCGIYAIEYAHIFLRHLPALCPAPKDFAQTLQALFKKETFTPQEATGRREEMRTLIHALKRDFAATMQQRRLEKQRKKAEQRAESPTPEQKSQ